MGWTLRFASRTKAVGNKGGGMWLSTVAAVAIVAIASANPVSAEDAKTVTVGAILPITGFLSTLGPPERDAMQMGIEEINKAGFEVGGQRYKLTLKVLDDEFESGERRRYRLSSARRC